MITLFGVKMANQNEAVPGLSNFLPLPEPINLTSGNVIENIALFEECWSNYEIATGLDKKDQKIRVATLLQAIGLDCFKAYKDLPLTEEDKATTDGILKGLAKNLAPNVNVIYERYVFNTSKQEEDESVDQFIRRLRRLIEKCNYGQLKDELLRVRIVVGISDTNARKKMLTQDNLTLLDAISTGRAMESTVSQLKSMSFVNPVKSEDDVNKITSKPFKKTIRGRICKFCGRDHEFKKEKCPAFGKKCNKCGRQDHFAKVCQSGSLSGARSSEARKETENIRKVKMISDNEYEEVEENCLDDDLYCDYKRQKDGSDVKYETSFTQKIFSGSVSVGYSSYVNRGGISRSM